MLPPALAAVLGVLLALGTLTIDRAVADVVWIPTVPAAGARTLAGSLIGAVVTVAVFTFWMRTVMVQLVSSEFSPRILSVYLEDTYQRTVIGSMTGVFAYAVVVLLAIPDGSTAPVPVVSLTVATLATGAGVAAIVVAMRDSSRTLEVSELVRRIADDVTARVEHAAATAQAARPEVAVDREGRPLVARATGWLQRLDRRAAAATLSDDAVVRLDVCAGSFVMVGDPIATVVAGGVDEDAFHQAVTIGRVRTRAHDIGFGLQQLVDIAEGSLHQGSTDASTAYEAIAHVGAVLRTLVRVGAPTGHAVGPDGVLVAAAEPDEADHIREVFDRLSHDGGLYPPVTRRLLDILGDLRVEGSQRERDRVVVTVEALADRLIRRVRAAGALDDDVDALRRRAERRGLLPMG